MKKILAADSLAEDREKLHKLAYVLTQVSEGFSRIAKEFSYEETKISKADEIRAITPAIDNIEASIIRAEDLLQLLTESVAEYF